MFGLNFIQTGFLFAGLAAAIPIAIHLLLKQRARRVDIGSVRFLQQVIRQHNRLRRIRQWLLLAARVITTLLLAMLFARPFFDRTALEAGEREVIYLIDRSASMRFGETRESIFAAARTAVAAELAQVHERTAVRVALFDSQGINELDWEQELDIAAASYAGTDFGKAISWARDALMQSGRSNQEVVIFTDLQKVGIDRTRIGEFPAHIKLQIRDMGHSLTDNVSIARATAVATEIRPKLPPTIEVDLLNGAPSTTDDFVVHLTLRSPAGGVVTQKKEIALSGFERETVTFPIEPAVPGFYTGTVELDVTDDLAFDNRRHVSFEARHPDRLLLVDGQEGNTVYGNETYFLETALQVGSEVSQGELPTYEVERIVWEDGRGFPSLQGFRVIVLANIGRFTTEDAQRLSDYLAQGGCLLICAGDQFTRRAAQPLADANLLPASIDGLGRLGPYSISEWQQEHPIFLTFADPQYGDIRRLRFHQLALLKPRPEAEILAQTRSGDPVLVEHSVGAGRVLLWGSSIDSDWTSWPRSRLYVPLVRQLIGYLTDQHLRGQRIQELAAEAKPGIRQEKNMIQVFNVPTEESELARVTPEEFRQALNLPEKQEMSDLTPEQLAALAPPAKSERPEEVWRAVAWLLLGWLVVETFLAGRVHA